MKLHTIDTGFFKLDGGAMYGVVPKVIWNKLNPSDEKNLCTWAMRCLLIEEGNQLILIDTGMGNKQSDKFFGYYEPTSKPTLQESIENAGYSIDDIKKAWQQSYGEDMQKLYKGFFNILKK
jgi:hypothetical protein